MNVLGKLEQDFLAEVRAFEQGYKHRVNCPKYHEVGYCKHLETAERKKFAEKRMLLMQLRFSEQQ